MKPLAPLLALLPLAACSSGDDPSPGLAIEEAVHVGFHPLEYVARRIAGDAVPVVNPLPAGQDPAHWTPPREVLAQYQGARLVLLNGAGYERWVRGVSLPRSRVVETAKELPEGTLIEREVVTHSHGLEGEHSHGAVDGYLWVDPELLGLQARVALRAMERTWPEHEEAFRAGYRELDADLTALADELRAAVGDEPLLAAQDGFEYLGRGLELDVRAVDLAHDAPPETGALRRLEALQEERPARVLLWERAPLPETAALLEEHLGLASVVYDPAVNPDEGDYLSIQRANVARLEEALR